jgi:hypothetical protein
MRKLFKIMIGAAVLIWALLFIVYPTYTIRYRMTIEALVNGQTRSGAGVIQVSFFKQPRFFLNLPLFSTKVSGEAIFLDLGNGQNIFALLASGPNAKNIDYPYQFILEHFRGWTPTEADIKRFTSLRTQWTLSTSELPTFVTFSNPADIRTARVVAPDEFEAIFGEGIRFSRAHVEMVSAGIWPFNAFGWPLALAGEPLTSGIKQNLPWWNGPFPQRITREELYGNLTILNKNHFKSRP